MDSRFVFLAQKPLDTLSLTEEETGGKETGLTIRDESDSFVGSFVIRGTSANWVEASYTLTLLSSGRSGYFLLFI